MSFVPKHKTQGIETCSEAQARTVNLLNVVAGFEHNKDKYLTDHCGIALISEATKTEVTVDCDGLVNGKETIEEFMNRYYELENFNG